jgi:hypothetical protein
MVGNGKIETEHMKDRADRPFGLTQRQPKHGTQPQPRRDRQRQMARLPAGRGAARHAAIAAAVNQTVRLPRRRRAASYTAQFVTRCRCFAMWCRRSALALNGTATRPSVRKGTVPLRQPAADGNPTDPCNNVA